MIVRAYENRDLQSMIEIWNEVEEEGIAFPQEELLDNIAGAVFLRLKLTPLLQKTKTPMLYAGFIYCIPTISAGADIFVTQATPSVPYTGAGILENSSYLTACVKQKSTRSQSYNLTQ